MSEVSSKLTAAALRVRELQDRVEYLEVHGRYAEFINTLNKLAAARSEMDVLAERLRKEQAERAQAEVPA